MPELVEIWACLARQIEVRRLRGESQKRAPERVAHRDAPVRSRAGSPNFPILEG